MVKREQKNNKLYKYGNEIDIGFVNNITRDNKLLMQSFRCDKPYIQTFIRKQSFKDKSSVSYVTYDKKLNLPISILTIACSGIYINRRKHLLHKVDVIPSIEIKYFAVNDVYRSLPISENIEMTLSKFLFNLSLKDITEITRKVCGARKILLYSVPEAVSFYKEFGFIEFRKFMLPNQNGSLRGCVPMFLSLD